MPALPPDMAGAIQDYPDTARDAFLTLRQIILDAAAQVPETGPLTETLKWGEPAWLTHHSKRGTTLRVAWKPARPDRISIFVNCQSSMLNTVRDIYPDAFEYEGNRALHLDLSRDIPAQAVEHLAKLAQSYHVRRR